MINFYICIYPWNHSSHNSEHVCHPQKFTPSFVLSLLPVCLHILLFCSIQSCPAFYDSMDCSTPGFPVHHQLPELAQTHVHQVGDAIQPSHPLLSPSPPAASGSFPVSQLFLSDGQNIGASASASVLPMNYQGWFPLGWTGLISLLSRGLSKVFSNTTVQKHQFCRTHLSHLYMITGKTIALNRWTFAGKVMSLLFNMLSRFVIAFLPRSKHLLISWLQSPSAVISEPPKIKSLTLSTVSSSICYEVMGPDVMILVFWMLSFKPAFHSLLSSLSRGSLILLCFLPWRWCHLHIWGYWYFSQQSWFQLVLLPAQHFS